MNEGLKYLLRNHIRPETLFIEMVMGLIPKTTDKFPETIFYWKNGQIWFEEDIKNKRLWCSYEHVWSVFSKLYCSKHDETQTIIKESLETIGIWKELSPQPTSWASVRKLETIDELKVK